MRKTILIIAIGLVEILSVTAWYATPVVPLSVIVASSLVFFSLLGFTRRNIIFYLVIGATGFLAEAVCVWGGAWSYATPYVFALPIWLPFLWGSAGLAIVAMYKQYTELW